MNELLIYTLQASVGLILMYALFWFFFRKDTFYKLNRFYLISSVFLSLLIPLFNFNFTPASSNTTIVVMLDSISITSEKAGSIIKQNISLYQGLLIAYLTGVAIFSLRFLFEIIQIIRLIRKNRISKRNNIKIVHLKEKYAPFSFLGYIFINDKDSKEEELKKILDHELIHIRQNHSLDLIFIELLTILQWFNPVVWLYRRSIKETHEFLADEELLNKGYDISCYQKALMHHAFGIQLNDITNNFNYSILKRRIIMMTKQKTKGSLRFKYLLLMPLLALLIAAFACNSETEEVQSKQMKNTPGGTVYMVVDKMPEFPGGTQGLMNYLAENIEYPETAIQDSIEGKVFISFVIDKDGSIYDVEVLRGVREDLDNEAIRVVRDMPDWIPGEQNGVKVKVKFNLPVKYTLQ